MWYQVQGPLAIDALYVNFLPSWWKHNYGIGFGERYVFDPDYRTEVWRFAQRTVAVRFPDLGIGSADPQPTVIAPDFGNAVTAAAAGCEVVYPEDNYPWNRHLPWEAVGTLKVPKDLGQAFPYSEILSQVRHLNDRWGQDVRPWLPTRGVLNDAVLIGGHHVLAELAAGGAVTVALLKYTRSMLLAAMHYNHQVLGGGEVFLGNCTVMMVGPALYQQKLLADDRCIGELALGLGQEVTLHHCGVFDPYLNAYVALPPPRLIEIGWGSDIRAALDAFPASVIQYIFSASFMASAHRRAIEDRVQALLDAAGDDAHRFRLSVPDLEYGTPDENLHAIHECCRQTENH